MILLKELYYSACNFKFSIDASVLLNSLSMYHRIMTFLMQLLPKNLFLYILLYSTS